MIEEMRAFDGRVRVFQVEAHADARGRLTPFSLAAIPFVPLRAFWVDDLLPGTTRGGHAHRSAQQLLVCLAGEVEVELCYLQEHLSVRLDQARQFLLIGPGVWSQQTYVGPGASLFVLVDQEYDVDSYIHEKQ